MLDGIYRITLTNKNGRFDRFPASLSEGELKAWNAHFSLSGTVNYYDSEIYIMKSAKGILRDSIIENRDSYSFKGLTTLHSDGFTVIETGGLEVIVVAIKEDNYLHNK